MNTVKRFPLWRPRLMRKEEAYGYLMAAPAILGFFIFTLGPLLASLWLSFTDYSVTNVYKFVGLANYKRLFSGADPFFYKSLGVTLYYVALSVPITIVSSFLMALLLKQKFKGRGLVRVIVTMPSIVPAVAVATIFLWLLNPDIGLFNEILRALHLPTSQFIYSETTVVPTLAMMNIWTMGSTMLIFLTGLENIPEQYYEAADVDGGGPIYKLFHITIPMMSPTIFFNLIMGLINGFQTFAGLHYDRGRTQQCFAVLLCILVPGGFHQSTHGRGLRLSLGPLCNRLALNTGRVSHFGLGVL